MSVDIVAEAFEKVALKKQKYKSVTVEKLLDLEYDLGTLLAIDTNEIHTKLLRSDKEKYLLNLARDNSQLLLSQLWQLPSEKVDDAVVVRLPKPSYVLPREKRLPKQRQLTKWEQFAKDKGLQKKKKAKVTWDDILQKWVPVHGYRRAAAEKERDWLLEVPGNAHPLEDQFEKKRLNHKEKVAKNEFQRLRNVASSHNIKVPHMGLPPPEKRTSSQLETAEGLAKISTASIGKFQPPLRNEKGNHKEKNLPGVLKRKQPQLSSTEEKSNNINIVDRILNKKPKLDIGKAVNQHIFEEDSARSEEKRNRRSAKGQGKKRKPNNKSFHGKKPPAGKGKRNPHTRTLGRKRR